MANYFESKINEDIDLGHLRKKVMSIFWERSKNAKELDLLLH